MKRAVLAVFIPVAMSLFLSVLHLPQASAECCYMTCGRCDNCKEGTPYCGVGPCNIFGCDCDCRQGPCGNCGYSGREKRAALEEKENIPKNGSHIIKSADRNFDGKLDLVEVIKFFKIQKNSPHHEDFEIKRAFEQLDKNGDQFLCSSEIDKF